jgi:tRNA(Ile)-lysidine synthase
VPERPVGDDELAGLFGGLAGVGAIGVAVSGGADSTALLLLLHRFAGRLAAPPRLVVFTVDHALRPGSAAECEGVVELAGRLGHEAEILRWEHGPLGGERQAEARAARYRLIAAAARARGIDRVALAHHRDDQAETFLIRLARGSDIHGLAGMRETRTVAGVTFLRPLLGLPKARLVATLGEAKVGFAEDPSNLDPHYLRARIRRAMPALERAGIGPSRLLGVMERCRALADRIGREVEALRAEALTAAHGAARVEGRPFLAADEAVQARFLAELLREVRGADYTPRLASVRTVRGAVVGALSAGAATRRTLGGVVVSVRKGRFLVHAEAGRAGFARHAEALAGDVVWDHRWRLAMPGGLPAGAAVAALGAAGRRRLGVEPLHDFPRGAVEALPALWLGGEVIAVGGAGASGAFRELSAEPVSEWLRGSP